MPLDHAQHPAVLQHAFAFDKRWRNRREVWRTPDDTFDPSNYGVDVISKASLARAFVTQHHYSGSYVAARLPVGIWRKTGVHPAELAGVAVFAVPAQPAVIPAYSGLPADQGCTLARFVLDDGCAFNAETWFLRRAFTLLSQEKGPRWLRGPDGRSTRTAGITAVISQADPMERHTLAGELAKRAHRGQIYAASNARFCGRSKPSWIWLLPDGRVLDGRGLSKVRAQARGDTERGRNYQITVREILAAGADHRHHAEDLGDWLARVLRPPLFRRIRNNGLYVYAFGLDRQADASIARTIGQVIPYPLA